MAAPGSLNLTRQCILLKAQCRQLGECDIPRASSFAKDWKPHLLATRWPSSLFTTVAPLPGGLLKELRNLFATAMLIAGLDPNFKDTKF